MSEFNAATLAQNEAADPAASTWVSANAGSGKTRVLTDRVARLLLHGTAPQKVLCLTYTKAAAAEMQNRLFARLGSWAMMPDDPLRNALAELGEPRSALGSDTLRHARTLFANALETPGGLKIQTIHSFCDKLLRQFPLEAEISPQFSVLEDRQAKLLRAEVLEQLADHGSGQVVDGLAHFMSGDDPEKLLSEIVKKKQIFAGNGAQFTTDDVGLDDMLAELLTRDVLDMLAALCPILDQGLKTDAANAEKFRDVLTRPDDVGVFGVLENMCLFGPTAAAPFQAKVGKIPTSKLRKAHEDLGEELDEFMLNVEEVRRRRLAVLTALRTKALAAFSTEFLKRYEAQKMTSGMLDYDDLIGKALGLLGDTQSAQWVLYKLDGGIDHILVDEAQDTSEPQWAIVKRLAEEFTTGQEDEPRTIFVVGDEKQSIYSFQGADPEKFGEMRKHFDEQFFRIGRSVESKELLYSFRSASPVLRLVDQVFDGPAGEGFAHASQHYPFKEELPGRVDVWPFLEAPEKPEDTPWYEPVDTRPESDPKFVLARNIAHWIHDVLSSERVLPGSKGNRAVQAGDFLILVQKRGPLFHRIIKELKAQGLPVAGADRMKLGEQLVVRDILSLLKFADLPEDDLSLAEALRSPILGLGEGDLFSVAYARKGTLWEAIRGIEGRFDGALSILGDVLKRADFLRPFELIERILTKHKARENLLARLGEEVEDGIDELLAQALRYEQIETPTLAGFLHWFQSGEVEIKREMDSGAGQIRVMTVHGAKGLEAPIVVLPDTASLKSPDYDAIVELADGQFVWKAGKGESIDAQSMAQSANAEFLKREKMRLLYVAMTRAEQWLVVAGAGTLSKAGDSWYELIRNGVEKSGAEDAVIAGQDGCRSIHYNWVDERGVAAETVKAGVQGLPDWFGQMAPVVERTEQVISPSKLPGAKVVAGPGSDNLEEAALRKGQQVHALLEHLPLIARDDWKDRAIGILKGGMTPQSEAEFDVALSEALSVLDKPEFAYLFAKGTLAEVAVTARIEELGNRQIEGYIDRLIVEPTRVLAVDFKTNAVVPRTPGQTPDGILRQMGAYHAALAQIYPDREIEVAVLWTANAQLMSVSHDIVMNALETTATS